MSNAGTSAAVTHCHNMIFKDLTKAYYEVW